MERADFRLLTLPLQTADKAMRALVVYSKNLVASPALPTTQLGRLDYLSNMGSFLEDMDMVHRSTGKRRPLSSNMRMWMRTTQWFKKTLLL
jgi:hypothetical protein